MECMTTCKANITFTRGDRQYTFVADYLTITYWQTVKNPQEPFHKRKQFIVFEPMDGGSHFKCLGWGIGSKSYPQSGSFDVYRIEQIQDILGRAISCEAKVEGDITFKMEAK